MRRVFLSALSAVVLFGFVSGTRAADDAMAIVTKAVKAHGGEEKLAKYKATRAKSKGTMVYPGAGELQFTQEVVTMLPNKFKDVLELSANGKTSTRTLWFNGDKFAIEQDGNEIKIDDDKTKEVKERLLDAAYMGKVSRLLPLVKEKGFEMSLVGEEKVEDKPAIGVLVKSKGHKDITLYFDKETSLLAKVQFRTVKEGTKKEETEERIVVAYEKENGQPFPKKIVIKHDGEKFVEAEVVERKMLEKIDDSEFTK
jgi:hypothetical protein